MPIQTVHRLWSDMNAMWTTLSPASKALMIYGLVMAIALCITCWISAADDRTLRDVGVWIKPMKFMAATALFSWTTVWLVCIADSTVAQSTSFRWITLLIIATSFFEVAYITYQGAQGLPSHYNTTDPVHLMMFGLMGIAAVALTFSQAWLAWEIWNECHAQEINVVTLGVLIGSVLTFVLATFSGFLLGGNQPPMGQGLPFLGWHLQQDIRPAHFFGVHAQQLIPLMGIASERYLGSFATLGLIAGSVVYVLMWMGLTWMGWPTGLSLQQ